MSKFNFRQIGGARSYRGWKNWEVGDTLTGKFIKKFEDQFGNPGYEIEVIETDFQDGKNIEEGKVMGLNSCGSLNYKMDDVDPGSVIQIEYNGNDGVVEKGPMKGKNFHDVNLSVADDNMVESAVAAQKTLEPAETEEYDL